MQYSKPSVNNFDINSLYNVHENIQVSLITDKFNNKLRPKTTDPLNKPIPKPNKDLSFFHPGRGEIRNIKTKLKTSRIKIMNLFMFLHIIILKRPALVM